MATTHYTDARSDFRTRVRGDAGEDRDAKARADYETAIAEWTRAHIPESSHESEITLDGRAEMIGRIQEAADAFFEAVLHNHNAGKFNGGSTKVPTRPLEDVLKTALQAVHALDPEKPDDQFAMWVRKSIDDIKSEVIGGALGNSKGR